MPARTLKIKEIRPSIGIEGGKMEILGAGFDPEKYAETLIKFGEATARVLLISNSRIVATIPEGAQSRPITIQCEGRPKKIDFTLGAKLSSSVQPVDNPVFDRDDNLYVAFSGRRDETVPVSVFKITPAGEITPYLSNIANATGMAFDPKGTLYVSSRFEGNVYKVTPQADVTLFAKELGVPTGMAFNKEGTLFVGDRSGRIWSVNPSGEASVFAEIPESSVAFHLAFDHDDHLLVTSPGFTSNNAVFMVDRFGKVIPLYAGFGRPQGLAVDRQGNIYVCDAKATDSSIVRITPQGQMETFLTGPVMVGLAFDSHGNMAVASQNAIYKINHAETQK